MAITKTPPNRLNEADYIITVDGKIIHLTVDFIFKLRARVFPESVNASIKKYLKDNFNIMPQDIEVVISNNLFF